MSWTIPSSWCLSTIGEVTADSSQRVPGETETFSYIDIASINRDTKRIEAPQRLLGKGAPSRARKVVRAGDVLVSLTRPNLNAVAMVPAELDDQIASTGLDVLRASNIDARWVYYLARSADFVQAMSDLVQGALYPAIRSKDVRSFEIPVAPLSEQKRIADKLDTLLARVDACRDRLDRVPAILKRFRQSVLAAACSGELTATWRGTGHRGQGKPERPSSWVVCKTREAGRIQLGRQRSPKFHAGANMRPYLRVQNVFEDRLDLSDVMSMEFGEADFERYQLHVGDILLNEGQSPEFLGRPAMYRGELPGACFTNTLIRFQAYAQVKPEFALLVFRHYMHAGRYSAEGTITTNIAHLGAGRFGEIEFPVPSIQEQEVIIARANALLALADRIEVRLNAARKQAERLTTAALAKAFRGELVPQDPNDEPATALLERIRRARQAAPAVRSTRASGRPRQTAV